MPLVTGGFVYTAFVIDAFAGTIAGWECSASKSVAFVRRAIAQAAAHLRESSAGLAAGGFFIIRTPEVSTPRCGAPSHWSWPA